MFKFKHYKPSSYKKSGQAPALDVQRFNRIMDDRECSGVNPYAKPDGFYEIQDKKDYALGVGKGSE